MNYWFYLEPYAFLFHNENKAVIYNTLNSAYLVCPNHPHHTTDPCPVGRCRQRIWS